jgi:hypothetical protein
MIHEEESPTDSSGSREGLQGCTHHENCTTLKNPVNSAIKAEGRVIGYLLDHAFRKRVQGSKHMLKKPPAWCISKAAFCEQILPNTGSIIVEDMESGLTYQTLTETFAEYAFEIQRGSFEPQLALTLNYGERQDNGHRQVGLWEGGQSSA